LCFCGELNVYKRKGNQKKKDTPMETAMANAKEIVESMENSEQNRQETSRHQADLVCPGVLSRMNKNKTQKRTNDK